MKQVVISGVCILEVGIEKELGKHKKVTRLYIPMPYKRILIPVIVVGAESH